MTATGPMRLLGIATQGGGGDEARLRDLLAAFDMRMISFHRGTPVDRLRQVASIAGQLVRARPDLVVMEGTGVAGGIALLLARVWGRVPYVVSTGDAVGPFVGAQRPELEPVFGAYERLLYRLSAGVIGWTPYIAGRALTFGSPRAVTVPGWSRLVLGDADRGIHRRELRAALGIPEGAIVVGICGSIDWNQRRGYCYGSELVAAAHGVTRPDVHVLVVGGGTGLERLQRSAGDLLGSRVHLVGRVPAEDVARHLAAMDVGSLPQSRDRLGSFRYSTKLPEYLGAGLPVVTGRLPLAYDLDEGWLWRLPGRAPWSPVYVDALTGLLNSLSHEQIQTRRRAIARSLPLFDRDAQLARVTAFLTEIIEEQRA